MKSIIICLALSQVLLTLCNADVKECRNDGSDNYDNAFE